MGNGHPSARPTYNNLIQVERVGPNNRTTYNHLQSPSPFMARLYYPLLMDLTYLNKNITPTNISARIFVRCRREEWGHGQLLVRSNLVFKNFLYETQIWWWSCGRNPERAVLALLSARVLHNKILLRFPCHTPCLDFEFTRHLTLSYCYLFHWREDICPKGCSYQISLSLSSRK